MSTNVMLRSRFPFDIPTWAGHLNSTDPLAMVIRAHLYVEAILIRQIETVAVHKEQFDSADLRFPIKVKLAVALGKLDPTDLPALNALNKLRNRFAHDLNTQVQEQDELKLYSVLSKRQRTIVDALRTPQLDYIGRLRCDLGGIIAAANEMPS